MPPTEFTIFGLTFHLYGLIVGISFLIGLILTEKILGLSGYKNTDFWQLSIVALLGGLTGARAWHVMTDWRVYEGNWVSSLYVWNGGLSILGAVMGGLITVAIYDRWRVHRLNEKITQLKEQSSSAELKLPLLVFLDAVAIALPFAHAFGRLANWVNQELFGPPTSLPWGIPIQVDFRPIEYLTYTHFHPLFLYEMLLNLLIGGILLIIYLMNYQLKKISINKILEQAPILKRTQDLCPDETRLLVQSDKVQVLSDLKENNQVLCNYKLGSGNYLLTYMLFYSTVRFGLDFIRIEKSVIFGGLLGFNQFVLLLLMGVSLLLLKNKLTK